MHDFQKLIDVMHKLRQECPWDREQNLLTLRSYLIEEAYECLEAIPPAEAGAPEALIEELGDLLLQICFQSEILSEKLKRPVINEVISGITEKLIRRHPHVFSELQLKDSKSVLENWEQIKKREKGSSHAGLFEDFKAVGPSLQTAFKIGSKSKRTRFDWDHSEQVWNQVESEIKELKAATSLKEKEEELGDLLFCLAQWARHEGLDPEVSLQGSNQKFLRRYRWMEEECQRNSKEFLNLSAQEKEALWKQAKIHT